ncbi:MAG: hypothetical protein HY514_00550 [Candidatus Aenigmarchaeota archaeon]|nr:hypothetical protein [Candidatus Aenigmarchaeota archaeon]
MRHVFFALIAVVLVAGCVQQDLPITEITIPGHTQIYTFNNDIRQSILVKAESEPEIFTLFQNERHLNIVFNGTDELDNGMFRIVLIDINAKIPFYFASQGKGTTIDVYYFISDNGTQWYNFRSEPIPEPALKGLTLWLKGPATGATETSITLQDKTVLLQGTSQKNLSLAADKLVLIVFDINSISDIKGVSS